MGHDKFWVGGMYDVVPFFESMIHEQTSGTALQLAACYERLSKEVHKRMSGDTFMAERQSSEARKNMSSLIG